MAKNGASLYEFQHPFHTQSPLPATKNYTTHSSLPIFFPDALKVNLC